MAARVVRRQAVFSWSREKRRFHLTSVLVVHQKEATLSSKRPRSQRHMRFTPQMRPSMQEVFGAWKRQKGRKRRAKERRTVEAMAIRWERL